LRRIAVLSGPTSFRQTHLAPAAPSLFWVALHPALTSARNAGGISTCYVVLKLKLPGGGNQMHNIMCFDCQQGSAPTTAVSVPDRYHEQQGLRIRLYQYENVPVHLDLQYDATVYRENKENKKGTRKPQSPTEEEKEKKKPSGTGTSTSRTTTQRSRRTKRKTPIEEEKGKEVACRSADTSSSERLFFFTTGPPDFLLSADARVPAQEILLDSVSLISDDSSKQCHALSFHFDSSKQTYWKHVTSC
jgi:hypothetical protein